MTQILVTKPGTLTAADRKKLRAADIVAVEAENPEEVRLLGAEGPALSGSDITFAALKALASHTGDSSTWQRETFAKVMFAVFDERRKAAPADAA